MSDGMVVLAMAPIPFNRLDDMANLAGNDAIISPELARMAGANLAIGPPDSVEALIKRLRPFAEAKAAIENPDLSLSAVRWLGSGEQGRSALTLFHRVFGRPPSKDGESHPHDIGDFIRCRRLIEQVPEVAERFRAVMPEISPTWAALIERWDDLCASMDREWPEWRHVQGRFPKTYERMKACLAGARSSPDETLLG